MRPVRGSAAEQGGELAGVAEIHLCVLIDAGGAGEVEVGLGDVDPVRLVLHPEGAAAEMDGLDEGGADPAHRVEHQIAGLGVVGDGVRGDRGQHFGRVRGRLGGVAAGALGGR